MLDQPRRRRRKEARPGEIVAAALDVFTERGFAAARVDEVAARAGISKGTVFLYFPTKQALFEAVVRATILPNVEGLLSLAAAHQGSGEDLLRAIFLRVGRFAQESRIGAVAKIVIGESRNFPHLAQFWHAELITKGLSLLAQVIARGQSRGEFRSGDPAQLAVSLFSPVIVGEIWRETFVPVGAAPFDTPRLIESHAELVIRGLKP